MSSHLSCAVGTPRHWLIVLATVLQGGCRKGLGAQRSACGEGFTRTGALADDLFATLAGYELNPKK